jgi:segregation and condensation protein B
MSNDNSMKQMDVPLIEDHEVDRVVEAILFAAAEPLKIEEISARFPEVSLDAISLSLERLVETYEARGFGLVCRDEAWAFRTSPDLSGYLTLEKSIEKKLSRAAMETLAIVAYHQPVTRAEIENIRGVAVGKGTLDLLIEAGWIQPGRRREVPGRPLTWKTAPSFLDHFGLESLKDLPGMDDLKAAGLLDRRPSFEIVPETAELFNEGENAGEGKGVEDAYNEDE